MSTCRCSAPHRDNRPCQLLHRSKKPAAVIAALHTTATEALTSASDAVRAAAEAETALDSAEAVLEEQSEVLLKRTSDLQSATGLAQKLSTISTDLSERLKLVRCRSLGRLFNMPYSNAGLSAVCAHALQRILAACENAVLH